MQDFMDPRIAHDFPNELFALFEDVGRSATLSHSLIGIGGGILERASIHIDTPNAVAWLEL